MNYLLDTHVLIWSRLDPRRLTPRHRATLTGQDRKFISTISFWEIGLKFASGRLELGGHTPEEFLRTTVELGYRIISPSPEHFAAYHRLPAIDGHKDPFDRMLIWQAIQSDLTLLSKGGKLETYRKHGLRVA